MKVANDGPKVVNHQVHHSDVEVHGMDCSPSMDIEVVHLQHRQRSFENS